MDIKMVKIDDIMPYENNPRHNEDAVEPVKESIKAYGFRVPMILDKSNIIVAGHTRYAAAQALGMVEVPVLYADDLSDEEIRAFRIADNKTSDFSIWDNKKLLEELEGLDGLFTGFNFDDLLSDGGVDQLNELDNSPILDNEEGVMFEVTFRSQDESKIERIKEMWESLNADTEE